MMLERGKCSGHANSFRFPSLIWVQDIFSTFPACKAKTGLSWRALCAWNVPRAEGRELGWGVLSASLPMPSGWPFLGAEAVPISPVWHCQIEAERWEMVNREGRLKGKTPRRTGGHGRRNSEPDILENGYAVCRSTPLTLSSGNGKNCGLCFLLLWYPSPQQKQTLLFNSDVVGHIPACKPGCESAVFKKDMVPQLTHICNADFFFFFTFLVWKNLNTYMKVDRIMNSISLASHFNYY